MRVIVPFDSGDPKTRLSSVLTERQRTVFARAMLRDVIAALRRSGHAPEVVATGPVPVDAPVAVDSRPLVPAVNDAISDPPVAVVMADLPLLTPDVVRRLLDTDGDVVLAPGRGGGTNAVVVRDATFDVTYHDTSFLANRARATELDVTLEIVDSYRLGTDIDEPEDLSEVLIHGDGRAPAWLRGAGFRLGDPRTQPVSG
jgi:2-phospho-L-lactate guanylyltransferase